MPIPKTDAEILAEIRAMRANNPRMSARAIRRHLLLGGKKAPSERTIHREIEKFKAMNPEEQKVYKVFRWPDSMEDGIPWEASRALFDLLRVRADKGRPAPLVDEAKWFWRVTQAIPEAPITIRADIAGHLTLVERYERQPHPGAPEILQRLLTYQPWRSEADKQAYEAQPKKAVVAMMRESHIVSIDLVNPYARQLIGREGLEKGYGG